MSIQFLFFYFKMMSFVFYIINIFLSLLRIVHIQLHLGVFKNGRFFIYNIQRDLHYIIAKYYLLF
jgi:hypothetical protein